RLDDSDALLASVVTLAQQVDRSTLDDIHEIAGLSLAEHDLARCQAQSLWRQGLELETGRQVHDAIGEGDHPLVVGRDDDQSSFIGELAEQPDHRVDLYVVDV